MVTRLKPKNGAETGPERKLRLEQERIGRTLVPKWVRPAAVAAAQREQELIEVRTALLARALAVLQRLERLTSKVGGYMTPGDQLVLHEARGVLAEAGLQPSDAPPQTWVDREQCVTCHGWFPGGRAHHCTGP